MSRSTIVAQKSAPAAPTSKTAEGRSKAEYQRRRRQQAHDLYFRSVEEKANLRALAEADGYAHDFNAWLLLKVHAALSGSVFPADYVDALKREGEQTRRWLEAAEERNETLRRELESLRAQRDALLADLMDIPEGAALAKHHLQAKGALA